SHRGARGHARLHVHAVELRHPGGALRHAAGGAADRGHPGRGSPAARRGRRTERSGDPHPHTTLADIRSSLHHRRGSLPLSRCRDRGSRPTEITPEALLSNIMHAIPAARRKLIESIATAARSLKRRGDPVAPDSFVKLYYHGVAEEDLAQYTPEELAAAALGHLRFAAQRRRGKPAIRLYSPSEDAAHTFVEVVVEDMPFLVDSLAMVLNQAGCIIDLMVHPVLAVRRDRAGRLLDVVEESAAQPPLFRESWQQIRIDRIVDEHKLQALHDRIAETLEDVRLAVTDWQAMCAQATAIGAEIERDADGAHAGEAREIKALLDWMVDNHFTFLGYREYRLRRGRSEDVLEALPDTGLGILRARPNRHLEPTRLRGELRERARDPERLIITKANSI